MIQTSFFCLCYVVQWIDPPYDSHLVTCTTRSYLFIKAHLASAVCSVSCQRLTATGCELEYPLMVALYVLPPFVLALAELQQADLITSEECEELSDISDVVRGQRGKSPDVMSESANILRGHGLEEESSLLAGRQSRPHPFACVTVCCHSRSSL